MLFPYAPWLCWLIPIIGCGLTPLFALASREVRDYAPAVFIMGSVVFSLSMIPNAFMGNIVDWISGEVIGELPLDWQLPWIDSLWCHSDAIDIWNTFVVLFVKDFRVNKKSCNYSSHSDSWNSKHMSIL